MDKLKALLVVVCMLSYAEAGSVSIGTASVRGDMRVDNYTVKDSATLFDGSVVETGPASADLHLGEGTEIRMASSSRGTLHRDSLVLQQGASELSASNHFKLEAEGLSVVPSEPNSRGTVSLGPGNTVGGRGAERQLRRNEPERHSSGQRSPGSRNLICYAGGSNGDDFSAVGMVSYEGGQYFLTTTEDVKYELTCKDFRKFVGTKAVVILGKVEAATTGGLPPMVCVKSIQINGATGLSAGARLIIAGVSVGAGAGIGFAVHAAPNRSLRQVHSLPVTQLERGW